MNPPSGSYAALANYRLQAGAGGPGVIVLLHGLGGDLEQLWGVTGPEVGGRPAAILAPDARAHGETRFVGEGPLNFDVLGLDLLTLVDRLRLGPRLVLVGVSMGAATALRVALDGPQRVHGLVLVRPAWLHERWPENLAPFGEIAALLSEQGPAAGRARFEASRLYQEVRAVSPSTASSLLAQFDKPYALARVRRLEDLPGAVPYQHPDDLRAVRAPTLVVGAPGDPVHPVRFAEELAGLIPGSRLALITPRDLSPERNLAELKAAVGGFVAGVPPIGPSPVAGHR
jgi:pimeloyl-ACP methyl ester carboxylesterase